MLARRAHRVRTEVVADALEPQNRDARPERRLLASSNQAFGERMSLHEMT